jgi:hypothetical protein
LTLQRAGWLRVDAPEPAAESRAFNSDPTERVSWVVFILFTAAESAFTIDPAERAGWLRVNAPEPLLQRAGHSPATP